ncbi:MAG: MaoC family dehydratase N-terminal domain-containing protein, partial [Pseudomonadota bacterium]
MSEAVDTGAFADWVGRKRVTEDIVSERLTAGFRATLSPHLAPLEEAPLGIHWCLAPDMVEAADLGPDGHPRQGLVLPAVPFGNRMWAGGALTFHAPLSVGDRIEKISTIEDIAFKSGRTGRLCFVRVRHTYAVAGTLMINERQDIVYREEVARASAAATVPGPPIAQDDLVRTVAADPVLLMRYSALTFNGHRIHYDHPYATGVEGYTGLVVHGPLQATLILNLAATALGRALSTSTSVAYLNEPRWLWSAALPQSDVWTTRALRVGGRLVLT